MIKIKVSYSDELEKKKILSALSDIFIIKNISKEYKKEGSYRRIHMNLLEK
ncbi:hypothetical protein OSC52_18680 [Clostridium pasteurianum]|uniref:hypothetical protein n=1 Tax=Clostridium pasteurianum TaxID=1501 RepID=UPI0022608581|nr:hypothetical protein [Clostridium pasteurianum]UZW13832.1 hypothetical protein OSC52_18680 [Clostridium pasteurianum]